MMQQPYYNTMYPQPSLYPTKTIDTNNNILWVDGEVGASATGTAAGDLTIELVKAGIVQPQGQATATLAAGSTVPLSFTSLVQVSQNNTCRCCDSPTILQVMSNDVDVTYPIVDITVTKIC